MKTKRLFLIMGLSLTLMLTGCAASPSGLEESAVAVEDSEYVTIGSHLTVHKTDDRLTLVDHKDALASDGMYYASWTAGSPEEYENSEGDTVDLYDAQLYLLLAECKTAEAAEDNGKSWLDAGYANYEVTADETIICNGQTYTLLSYQFSNEENPYSHGVSAFGVFENCAVCVEFACQEAYGEDLKEMLTDFLEGCSYK
ncbi:MAG: hypothetical protein K2N37_09615 [Lachnospiraceae bacterium]|nr:hypothetical protein [Lachnospiraceae bacterium]